MTQSKNVTLHVSHLVIRSNLGVSVVNACPPSMIKALLDIVIKKSLPSPSTERLGQDDLSQSWKRRALLFDPCPTAHQSPLAGSELGNRAPSTTFWETIKKTFRSTSKSEGGALLSRAISNKSEIEKLREIQLELAKLGQRSLELAEQRKDIKVSGK